MKSEKFLILIIFSILFFSCQNPFDLPKQEKSAEGKGYFSLTLGAGTRTIMPIIVQGDFSVYTLEFFAAGTNTTALLTVDRTGADLSEPMLLDAGSYDLYVNAYFDTEKTKAAARGELKNIVIGTGATTIKSITLNPIADGIKTGTFSWDIEYPESVTEASMTITRLPISPVNEAAAQTFSFTGDDPTLKNNSLTLDTGYYRVVFKLKTDDDLTAEFWETLHIYENMESVFEHIFTEAQLTRTPEDNEDFGVDAVISERFNVSTTAEWNTAVQTITGGGNNLNYIINILGDFNIAGRVTATFGNKSGIKVSLRGVDNTLSLFGNGSILRIESGQSVALRDLTLRGHASNDASLVYVSGTNAIFTMQSGVISGNTASGSIVNGGGVYVSGGTFTMNGGKISGNTASASGDSFSISSGGGVHVSEGTFTMNGGEISGNIASGMLSMGGGVSIPGGIFTMQGGKISGNTASIGGGVYVNFNLIDGEIVYGTFRIVTGTIYGSDEGAGIANIAEGSALSGPAEFGTFNGDTWVGNGTLEATDETILVVNGLLPGVTPMPDNHVFNVTNTAEWNSALSSIAVYGSNKNYTINVQSDFSVVGRSANTFGGAKDVTVSIQGVGRTLTLSGNGSILSIGSDQTVILRDLTLRGHGSNNASLVSVDDGTFTMYSGKISGNTRIGVIILTSGSGGGVSVYNGIFTMHNGEISGNTANIGGGVFVSGGTFTMNDGKISDNTASASDDSTGGGVFVSAGRSIITSGGLPDIVALKGTFTMNGGKISGNTASNSGLMSAGGGGVFLSYGADLILTNAVPSDVIFNMNGGEISDNTADYGGGVGVENGTFHISKGTIYGSGEGAGIANIAAEGAALYRGEDGIAQHGTFIDGEWNSKGDLVTTNNTIRMLDGNPQ
jgi:hypothetical protein